MLTASFALSRATRANIARVDALTVAFVRRNYPESIHCDAAGRFGWANADRDSFWFDSYEEAAIDFAIDIGVTAEELETERRLTRMRRVDFWIDRSGFLFLAVVLIGGGVLLATG